MAQSTAVKVIDKPEASALGEMVNAELANQIATAKKYPRDEDAALRQLEKLATRSDAVAEQCMYTLKRTQKNKDTGRDEIVFITGPSIHFMQLLAYCWGNMRAGARIVSEEEKTVTAQGLAYDLQRNNGLLVEIKRGITTSKGYRYGQDMINVTSNAACSIAERNAIEDCIPRVLWWDVYERIKAKAVGAAQIPERIQQAVKFFVSKGAKQDDILAALGVKALDELDRTHLEIFIGLRQALKEGQIDAAKIFTAEGADQRERLTLVASDDPADPNVPGAPIDALFNRNGGRPEEPAAAKGLGDGGPSQPREASREKSKGKAARPPAGSAAPAATAAAGPDDAPEEADKASGDGATQPSGDAADGQSAASDPAPAGEDAYREDELLVAHIEAKLDPSAALSSRRIVNANRGALARIAETSPKTLAARAARILQDWPAK